MIFAMLFLQSCQNYYRISESFEKDSTSTIIAKTSKNYYILRVESRAYHMDSLRLSKDSTFLTCKLQDLPPEHTLHLTNGRGGHMRIKANRPERVVLTEVHVYVKDDTNAVVGARYILPLEKIEKIEVLEMDKGKSSDSHIGGAIGITILIWFGLGAIVLLLE